EELLADIDVELVAAGYELDARVVHEDVDRTESGPGLVEPVGRGLVLGEVLGDHVARSAQLLRELLEEVAPPRDEGEVRPLVRILARDRLADPRRRTRDRNVHGALSHLKGISQ